MSKSVAEEIISKIFNVLKDGKKKSISALAHEAGLYYSTVEKYVGIMRYLQRQPQIEMETLQVGPKRTTTFVCQKKDFNPKEEVKE